MRTKQFGTLPLLVLAAILAGTIIIGLGVIYFLDKSMVAQSVSQAEIRRKTVVQQPKLANDTTQIEPSNDEPTLGAAQDIEAIKKALETLGQTTDKLPVQSTEQPTEQEAPEQTSEQTPEQATEQTLNGD